jgi:transcriptional regulator with XRE-family HTH domain
MSFKRCRLVAGLTQKQAADALGVDQSAVSLWDRGITRPRAALLPKVAKLYGCTVDELLAPDEHSITQSETQKRDIGKESSA